MFSYLHNKWSEPDIRFFPSNLEAFFARQFMQSPKVYERPLPTLSMSEPNCSPTGQGQSFRSWLIILYIFLNVLVSISRQVLSNEDRNTEPYYTGQQISELALSCVFHEDNNSQFQFLLLLLIPSSPDLVFFRRTAPECFTSSTFKAGRCSLAYTVQRVVHETAIRKQQA